MRAGTIAPLLLLLVACAYLACAEIIQRDPTYIVVAPRKIRPGQILQVQATILKLNYDNFTIIATVRRGSEEVASGQSVFMTEGSSTIQIKMPVNMYAANYTLRVNGFSNGSPNGLVFQNDTILFFDIKQVSVFIQTSRPLYHQGQLVHIRVIPVQVNLMAVATTVDIYVVDANGMIARRFIALHTNVGGVVTADYQLNSNYLAYGIWQIWVDCLNQRYNRTFVVQEFYDRLLYVNVSMPTYMMEDSLYGLAGQVVSNHTTGRGTVGNATIILQILSIGQLATIDNAKVPQITRVIPYFDTRCDFVFTRDEMYVAAGLFLANRELRVTAYVNDWFYNKTETGYQSSVVYSKYIKLRWLGGKVMTFKPNMPFTISLAGTRNDGSPIDPDYENRTVYIRVVQNRLNNPDLTDFSKVDFPNTSVIEYVVTPAPDATLIIVRATYEDNADTLQELRASKFWTPNNYYIQIVATSARPIVNEYMIFTVRTNAFVDKIYYHIVAGENIIVSDTLKMYAKQKIFSVAVSRDMVPSARIIAYLIAPDNQVVVDSFNFFVNGTRMHQMSVKFNRGKDFSYNTVEIIAKADPLSYVAFSAIEYSLYQLGARNGLTWDEVNQELYSYDSPANTSINFRFYRNGQIDRTYYASTPSYGYDANTTFYFAGLYVFTDANVSTVYTLCNRSQGFYPCMDGRSCYSFKGMCNGFFDCSTDEMDEMGCDIRNETKDIVLDEPYLGNGYPYYPKGYPLWRYRHIGNFYLDGSFMWNDQFVKPDGAVQIRVAIPKFPTSWVVSGFAMNKDSGLAIMPDVGLFDGVRPVYITVQGPPMAQSGEQIGLRISVFNYWEEELDILVTLHSSPDYSFVNVEEFGIVSSYAPRLSNGDHQVLINVYPGTSRQLNYPVVPMRTGYMEISVSATCFFGGDYVKHSLYVEWNGVPEFYMTNYQVDLQRAPSVYTPHWRIQVEESFLQPETRDLLYVPGSPNATLSVIGDIVGVSFFPFANNFLTAQNLLGRPYGSATQALYNLAANVLTLKMLRSISAVSSTQLSAITHSLNIAIQNLLAFMTPEGGFKEFRWNRQPSVLVSALACQMLMEARDRMLDLEKDFYVPPTTLNRAGLWLATQTDNVTGAFIDPSYPYHLRRLQSTLTVMGPSGVLLPANVSLTAHAVISMASLTDLSDGADSAVSATKSTSVQYLSQMYPNITDPYEMAVTAYALASVNAPAAAAAFAKLQSMARLENNYLYWSNGRILPLHREASTDAREVLFYKNYSQYTSYAVAATSYAMLTYLSQGYLYTSTEMDNAQRFLQDQHMTIGGFASTLDSMVALQALKKLAEQNQNRRVSSMTLNVTKSTSSNWYSFVSKPLSSWFDMFQVNMPKPVWGEVDVYAEGSGRALMQLAVTKYHEHQYQLRVAPIPDIFGLEFSMTPTGFNYSTLNYQICSWWNGLNGTGSASSGLAALEVGVPSGYVVENYTLIAFVKSMENLTTLRNAEFIGRKVTFYFEYLNSTKQCVNFLAFRWYPVANVTEQQPVRLYEYYEPANFIYQFYPVASLFKNSVCLVCASFQCPYCPHWAGGSHVRASVAMLVVCSSFLLFAVRRLTGRSSQLPHD